MISRRRFWLAFITLTCLISATGLSYAYAQFASLAAYNQLVATTYQLPAYASKPVRLIVDHAACDYLRPDFIGSRWLDKALCPQCARMAGDILARYRLGSDDACPSDGTVVMKFIPLEK